MEDCNPQSTPMETGDALSPADSDSPPSPTEKIPYQSAIGSLITYTKLRDQTWPTA